MEAPVPAMLRLRAAARGENPAWLETVPPADPDRKALTESGSGAKALKPPSAALGDVAPPPIEGRRLAGLILALGLKFPIADPRRLPRRLGGLMKTRPEDQVGSAA